ncbi:FAD-dependent oxidoreductase [Streptomyces sp. NPDC093591]|uniref:FAD-dependent oxidoreductase n=1 Tax=Streptomyces sp. NPDC093591 TaxID=3366044 RepID=UPI00381FD37D
MSSFHVLITGGGIGGLCLAQGLRKAGISCAVYERDPAVLASGYRLHMNGDGGRALRQCLPEPLYELYMQTSRTTPRRELLVELDHLGNELGTRPHIGPPNDPERPHTAVNRRTLRQIMAAGLEDILHFGRTATGCEADDAAGSDGGGGVRLLFEDGSSVTGDVLVAADGINSVIRTQLLPDVPVVDTGMRCLYAFAPLTDDLAAVLPDAVYDGFTLASGPNGALFAYGVFQPRRPVAVAVADLAPGAAVDPVAPYVMAALYTPVDSGLVPGDEELRTASAPARHDLMRAAVRGWHPGLVALTDQVDPSSIRPVSVRRLEPAEPWPTSRVTFLGDAIHAMPPTFGAGANTALRDAASLTGALSGVVHDGVPLLEAIAAYEADMRAEVFPILRAAADPRATDPDFLPDDLTVAGH